MCALFIHLNAQYNIYLVIIRTKQLHTDKANLERKEKTFIRLTIIFLIRDFLQMS